MSTEGDSVSSTTPSRGRLERHTDLLRLRAIHHFYAARCLRFIHCFSHLTLQNVIAAVDDASGVRVARLNERRAANESPTHHSPPPPPPLLVTPPPFPLWQDHERQYHA